MANAKKCDVCGKFYMQEEKKFAVNGSRVSFIVLADKYANTIERYDVCDDCAEKVYNLLEGGCVEGKEK